MLSSSVLALSLKTHSLFNYLTPIDGALCVRNRVECFVSHVCEENPPVVNVNNATGKTTDLLSISMLLHVLLLVLAFRRSGFHDDKDSVDMLMSSVLKLEELYGTTEVAFDYDDGLRLFLEDYEVVGIDNNSCIQNFICAYHDIFLDANSYMGWT